MITAQIKCPQCRKEVTWQDNPHRPFCSERCRLIDLGQWADESYRIAGSKQELTGDDNVVSINMGKQRNERS
jgi:endogenous inhibitor of DNA gyrase (YacG/DUF329 family)